MNRGLFISFEGPDGSGKSTQINFLKDYFANNNVSFVFTREPGGTPIGEALREIILSPQYDEMSNITETLLYAASRAQLVSEIIKPALNRGDIVICDRYIDSSIAYQGFGRNLGKSVADINSFAIDGLMPDLTFLISINPEIGMSRIECSERSELDRLEQEKIEFHRKVHQGYIKIASQNKNRIVLIDGTMPIEAIKDEIISHVKKALANRK